MFVTIEGIEGSGKSTLLSGLSERFRSEGREVLATREPGGTPLGERVREVLIERGLAIGPLAEVLLVNVARAQHVSDAIRPALARNELVLCDRFVDSTLAYQGYGRGVDFSQVQRICDDATDGLVPDLTFVLDLPVAVSRQRLATRGNDRDRMESEDDAFHERVRAGFLALATRSSRYRVLDATRASNELVEHAYALVAERFVA